MRFTDRIIIIGGGIVLAGLIHKVMDIPVIIVSHNKPKNAVLPTSTTFLPEPLVIDLPPNMGELVAMADYGAVNNKWNPRFGHVKRKTNKQRCKHNAKLKRR